MYICWKCQKSKTFSDNISTWLTSCQFNQMSTLTYHFRLDARQLIDLIKLSTVFNQIKCDEVDTSDEEEDEEIIHLKEKLERKRQEKKEGRLTIQQPAFSDDTTHSTTSEPSTATTSSSESEEVMVKGKGSNIVSLLIY